MRASSTASRTEQSGKRAVQSRQSNSQLLVLARRGSLADSYNSLEDLMTETLAVPAAVLEKENSYQNISETRPDWQTEPEDQTFTNQEIVLKTSQLYGVDLVRHLRLSFRTNNISADYKPGRRRDKFFNDIISESSSSTSC